MKSQLRRNVSVGHDLYIFCLSKAAQSRKTQESGPGCSATYVFVRFMYLTTRTSIITTNYTSIHWKKSAKKQSDRCFQLYKDNFIVVTILNPLCLYTNLWHIYILLAISSLNLSTRYPVPVRSTSLQVSIMTGFSQLLSDKYYDSLLTYAKTISFHVIPIPSSTILSAFSAIKSWI